jgi:N6-L-threonylcarbamoyladenine synthase
LIDKYAKEGDPKKFTFTKPKTDGLNYSFSGLKTNILYFIQKKTKENPDFISENRNDLCASIQECIVEILMINFEKAI